MQCTVSILFFIIVKICSIIFTIYIKHNRKQIASVTYNMSMLNEIEKKIVFLIFAVISFNSLMHNVPKWELLQDFTGNAARF